MIGTELALRYFYRLRSYPDGGEDAPGPCEERQDRLGLPAVDGSPAPGPLDDQALQELPEVAEEG